MEVEDTGESDEMGCKRVQFGVSGASVEAGLGCVGGFFLPACLDDGA